MTIQQFIERAIEGGWKAKNKPFVDKSETGWATVGFREVTDQVLVYHHEIFLDPEAWKAVGKVEGWPESYFPENKNLRRTDGWHDRMNRMIDALAEGKTTEEYLATL